MASDRLNSSEQPNAESDPQRTDVLNLSESEQAFWRWLIRKQEVNLAEAVAFLNQDEDVVQACLDSFIQQGLIQSSERQGERFYRAQQAAKKRSRLSQKIWQQLDE